MEKYKVRKHIQIEINFKYKIYGQFNNTLKYIEIIFRGEIRIEITDGLIRLTTNGDGTWINTNQPFDLKSSSIKKQELKNMFIGIKGGHNNKHGTMTVRLYKRTN